MQKSHIDGIYLILDLMGIDSNVPHEFWIFPLKYQSKKDIVSGFVNSISDIPQWR